ncbi:pantoate--beta-alanine ligase [Candidatus Deferrimicrobium sp.]|uniref:pantoate--beta-alanine ligase n=1 Tax=Candidatus Deferrimicrobium sp. TaxID=3060586 RepID=UPI002ED906F8
MERIRTPEAMRAWADARRAGGARIGLVPTMGYLHAGHVSLVRIAREAGSEAVAATIFVNPMQFGPGEDFEKYPRDEARDLGMLEAAGVDAVYLPGAGEMYPEGHRTFVEVTGVSQGLCGAARPGHFRGVATVVAKLFLASKPHVAVFGKKDYQQLAVIRAMNRDLDFGIEIVGAPIVREGDGLAMSSRNVYLSGEDRIAARCLSRGLFRAKELFGKGERDAGTLVGASRREIETEPRVKMEYAEGRDPDTLAPLTGRVDAVTILVAAKVGRTRLIDNITLGKESGGDAS